MDLEHFTISELLNRAPINVTLVDLAAVLPSQKVFSQEEAQALLDKAEAHAFARLDAEVMAESLSQMRHLPHYHDPVKNDYVYVLTYRRHEQWNFMAYKVEKNPGKPQISAMPGTVLTGQEQTSTYVFLARHVEGLKNTLPFQCVKPLFGNERVMVDLFKPFYDLEEPLHLRRAVPSAE